MQLENSISSCNNLTTVILAAGKLNASDKATSFTQSDALVSVNGRPVISWIVQGLMKYKNSSIVLVCNKNDNELISFASKRWIKKNNFHLAFPDNDSNILHSLKAGLKKILELDGGTAKIRIMLGDTILVNDYKFHDDTIYISDFDHDSRSWCVVHKDTSSENLKFYEKTANFTSPNYKALVGQYEFSDPSLLNECLKIALEKKDSEISSVLLRYSKSTPLNFVEVGKDNWIDCGHLEGVALARQKLIISRHFNSFNIDTTLPIITKKSSDKAKLAQEIFWYKNLPNELQLLTPRILNISDSEISMEFIGYGNLAEKFVYYDLPHNFWAYILERLFSLIKIFETKFQQNYANYKLKIKDVNFQSIYLEKMQRRIDALMKQSNFWVEAWKLEHIEINGSKYSNIPTIIQKIGKKIKNLSKTAKLSIVHGDLCFNNILFDIQSGAIKLIDPRGLFGDKENTILGDSRYDVAKIRHSYCGDYDSLIEGDFILEKLDANNYIFATFKANTTERENLFDSLTQKFGFITEEIRLIEALLFLTMIPLHNDSFDRQIAMWLTAIIKLNKEFSKNDDG